MKVFFVLTLAVMVCTAQAKASLVHGDIKYELELFMQAGFSKGIVSFVESPITFEYQNTRSVKSKADLEKILNIFFAQNKNKSFKISNHGTYKNMTRHMEGIYETMDKQKFQIYFEAVYDEVEAHHHLSRMLIEKNLD